MNGMSKKPKSNIKDPGKAMPFVRRDDVFKLYWYFAAERQQIWQRRLSGAKPPFTDDPILQNNKFCNTYRVLDRVSQDLIKQVSNNPISPVDDAFRTVFYRFFSKPETFNYVEQQLGEPLALEHLYNGQLEAVLTKLYTSGATLYTNAFILCANNAYGYSRKYQNHVGLFKDMFHNDAFIKTLSSAREIGEVQAALKRFPLIGDFMSFQLAVDLSYLGSTTYSQNKTVIAGPGALRGIAKAFKSTGGLAASEIIMHCWQNQEAYFNYYSLPFPKLGKRRLDPVDCQGLFCELDKYCRQAKPELKSSRSKIKQKFDGPSYSVTNCLPMCWL